MTKSHWILKESKQLIVLSMTHMKYNSKQHGKKSLKANSGILLLVMIISCLIGLKANLNRRKLTLGTRNWANSPALVRLWILEENFCHHLTRSAKFLYYILKFTAAGKYGSHSLWKLLFTANGLEKTTTGYKAKMGKKKPFDFQSREDKVKSKTNWHLKFKHWGSETIQFMGHCWPSNLAKSRLMRNPCQWIKANISWVVTKIASPPHTHQQEEESHELGELGLFCS